MCKALEWLFNHKYNKRFMNLQSSEIYDHTLEIEQNGALFVTWYICVVFFDRQLGCSAEGLFSGL